MKNYFSNTSSTAYAIFAFLLLILVSDVLLTVDLFITGSLLGLLLFMITESSFVINVDRAQFYLPLTAFMFLGGTLLINGLRKGNIFLEQQVNQQRQNAIRSLAGSIAHEIRNPLGQLRHSLNNMQHQLPPYQPSHTQVQLPTTSLNQLYQGMAQSQMAVKRGIQVIDLIMDQVYEKPIDATTFVYLDAYQSTQKALNEYGYDCDSERQRVSLSTTRSFDFRVDETLYLFVLFNLLKNALYYLRAYPDAHVDLRLGVCPDSNRVYVRDTGPGIAAEQLPYLFDRFHTQGKEDGTGLGLTYCQRVMRAFGGDITCHSVVDDFTEFTLSFPPVTEQDLADYQEQVLADARPDLQGKRILVVDDDQLYREQVKQYLIPLNMILDEATNGVNAIQKASVHDYGLVIMDLNMPQLDGYQATELLRRGEAGLAAAQLRIVAYTTEPDYIAQLRVTKAGMQGLLNKPCNQIKLVQGIQAVLRGPRPQLQDQPDPLQDCRVLLVDDTATIRSIIEALLASVGCRVTTATNGKEAVQLLTQQHFDLLVTDIRMPVMDGLELTRAVWEHFSLVQLPIIGLSGNIGDTQALTAMSAAGMDDYQSKADATTQLLQTLRGVLRATDNSRGNAILIETPMPSQSNALTSDQGPWPSLLDLDDTATRLGLSVVDVVACFKCFQQDYSHNPGAFQQALAADDRLSLQQLAHKLQGSAALLGMQSLQQVALELEQTSAQATSAELDALVQHLV